MDACGKGLELPLNMTNHSLLLVLVMGPIRNLVYWHWLDITYVFDLESDHSGAGWWCENGLFLDPSDGMFELFQPSSPFAVATLHLDCLFVSCTQHEQWMNAIHSL